MSKLRLFLDTADVAQWQRWLPTGLFHGVTTNPTLLKNLGLECRLDTLQSLVEQAVALGAHEVQVQAWGGSEAQYVETGRTIASLDARVTVKIPITEDGVRAARHLTREEKSITLTALYATHQAVTASALGVAYAAPYLGRLGDAGRDGQAIVRQMQAIVRSSDAPTRILVASIRSVDDIAALVADGLDTFTFSPAIAEQLFSDSLTLQAADTFEEHAAAPQIRG